MRVRFAPSPTGDLHLGGARTALMNYAFTKAHSNGKFILRIEDTDQERSSRASEEAISKALKACGILWDEGPDCGGALGPYRQSERLDIYKNHIDTLLENRKAYRCFFTDDELAQMKETSGQKIFRLPDTYRSLTQDAAQNLVDQGKPYTIRLDVSQCASEYTFKDMLKDSVVLPSLMVDDFVIYRSNGFPTYNFAAAVDDHLMEMTHVIRGEEHLSNTLRQLMVYDAFDWVPPTFLHMPLIMGRDAEGNPSKLSKRHGDVSVLTFLEKGVLPEAFTNYLLTLGYTYPNNVEMYSLDELISGFDLQYFSKSAAFWDIKKLYWYNTEYLKQMSDDDFFDLAKKYLTPETVPENFYNALETFKACIVYYKAHIELLSELPEHLALFFDPAQELSNESKTYLSDAENAEAFWRVQDALLELIRPDCVFSEVLNQVKEKTGLKGKRLFMSIRVALTNASSGPELSEIVDRVPTDWLLTRLRAFNRES